MKKMKKWAAVALALVMTMALGMTTLAAEAAAAKKGSLTVNVNAENTLQGQRLDLYKLFDLTVSGEGDSAKFGYTVSPEYKDALKKVLGLGENAADDEYYQKVSEKKDAEVIKKFAEDLSKEILAEGKAATTTSGKIEGEVQSYTFNDLDYGYYLVHQTGTTKLQSSLVSVYGTSSEIDLKGTTPSIEKRANQETVSINQVVEYTVTGMIPDSTGHAEYVYKIHDTLSKGLDFSDKTGTVNQGTNYNVSVKIGDGAAETVEATLSGDGNRQMSIDLSSWVRNHKNDAGKEFTVTYYAKVNEDAVVTEKNIASLEYGNKPGETTTTKPSEAKTPTYALNINKTDMKTTMLEGAVFRLYQNEQDALAVNDKAMKVKGQDGKYTVDADQTGGANMDMISVKTQLDGQNYNLQLNGLAAGTYYLVETKAPEGYNKIADPVMIKINKSETDDVNDWTLEGTEGVIKDKILDVKNSTGSLLPETGGMGTILFTGIAVVLIVGVMISFVVSRRKR